MATREPLDGDNNEGIANDDDRDDGNDCAVAMAKKEKNRKVFNSISNRFNSIPISRVF